MNLLKSLLGILMMSLLAACGGGGGSAGTPVLGGGQGPSNVADLVIVLSAGNVANTGADTVTATVTALDANRNAVANVPVTISADKNGVITPAGTATDTTGKLTATVGIGSDTSNRTITVTATTGAITRTAALSVTAPGPVVVASDIVLQLSASSVSNTGLETVTATVTALDANRNTLTGVPVTVTVDNNAIASASGTSTDAAGRVVATVGIGGDKSTRTINVTARSGTITRGATVQVTNAAANVVASDLVLVLSSTSVANNGNELIIATATALDANRNTIAGIPVSFTVDNNAVASASGPLTDTSGKATATVGIGADRTPRTINIVARTGNLVRSASLTVTSGTPAPVASDLVLTLSASSIANNGTQTVSATATALDAKRNALAGVPVTISVNSNAVATTTAATTNASGLVLATIGIGADRSNRTITVTATSGSLTRDVTLLVVDATGGTPVAADLSLVLSAPSLANSGTATIRATATAVDVNRNAVAGIPVTIKVDASAVASVSGSVTASNGTVTADVGVGSDRSNRVVTVTATSGTLTRSASFRVVGADLSATYAPLVNAGTTNNQVEYKLVDTNAAPMVGQSVSVSAPGLPSVTGTTDLNGKFVYSFSAPALPGTVVLTAVAAGDSEIIVVTVQAAGGGTVAPAPSQPQAASLALNPSVVSVNQVGSNANQTEIRALFLGADNAPIPRVRVRFDLDGNATTSDGVVGWLGGTYAYSDSNGVARGTFTPGQRSSPTNGITVRACYATTDFAVTECPNAVRTTLTVATEALSVNVRTNELIKEGAAQLTYIKEFVAMVVDAAGQAKADVLITPSVDLTGYYKGYWEPVPFRTPAWRRIPTLDVSESYNWTGSAWTKTGAASVPICPNEDVNRNGVREAGAFVLPAPALAGRAEDLNWNGDLDPRKADVAIKMVASARTDANGLAVLQIEYGKDLASWVDFVITVTATGVAGSESRARYAGTLPLPASAIADEGVSPAFVLSPYGTGSVCTDTQ